MTSLKDYKRRDNYGTWERHGKGSGQPEAQPSLRPSSKCKESFGVCLTGVYHVGQLGEESLWRTAAECRAYLSSYVQPLQEQVTFRFLQIKTGSASVTPGHKVPLIKSLWLGLGTVATLAGHSGEGQLGRTPVSPQFVALHTADKEQLGRFGRLGPAQVSAERWLACEDLSPWVLIGTRVLLPQPSTCQPLQKFLCGHVIRQAAS